MNLIADNEQNEKLSDYASDRFGRDDTGELLIQAAVEVRQPFMIKSHQMQNGGVQITRMMPVRYRRVT